MDFNGFSLDLLITVAFRSLVALMIGSLIGNERARHGRAAGMRTHIIVCLGAALTSMISLYANEVLGNEGDILRISAQVISGIGFLGAGMIILKSNDVIIGLTTAAGVWVTSVIGIAVGLGFYEGAIPVTVFFLLAIILITRFEKKKNTGDGIYLELDDMYKANEIVDKLKETMDVDFSYHLTSPKSHQQGHLGLHLITYERYKFDVPALLETQHVVFVEEEN